MRVSRQVSSTLLAAALALVAMVPRGALAQAGAVIRGTVTDSTTRQPVPSVSVTVAGTQLGSVTDASGAYTIAGVPTGRVTVRAQRIGFTPASRTITVGQGATATVDFALAAVAVQLRQVVSVGYGTESRRNVTGAVTTVTPSQITNTPVADVEAALQGKAPGVQVTQNAGEPGNAISVRIRGAASISASNQPLYVVDGVPVQNENLAQLAPSGQSMTGISGLDPNSIESITVLKDAASAAIYGSRASNGVILITTKRGQAGKARFSIDAYTGWQQAERKLDLMTGPQYVEYMNEGAVNDGYTGNDIPFTSADAAVNTNWQDAIFRTAPVSNIHLGVNGGSEALRFNLDGSYFNQQGIVIGSKYNRANGRVNVDYDASSRLTLHTSLGLSRENNWRDPGDNSDIGIVTNAIGLPSIYPVRDASGQFTNPDYGLAYSYTNPVAIGTYDISPTQTDHMTGSMEAKYSLTHALSFTGRAGADVLHMREDQWQSPLVAGAYSASAQGIAKSGTNNSNRYLLEGFFGYDVGSDSANSLNLLAGGSTEWNHDELNYVRGEGFTGTGVNYVRNATNITSFDGLPFDHNLQSVFARANYAYAGRYLLSGSLRADGSSRFGPNNRWGVFPAISAGWVLTQEPFMSGFGDRFGMFKLRASYGVTGNQGLTGNQFLSDYAYLGTYGAANYGTTPGIAPSNFANPNLKWESTKETDVGFDWYPWGGRVSVIGDYYHKATSNLLVFRPVPAVTGYQNVWDNIGNVLNTGFELGLGAQILAPSSPGGLSWRSDFNISTNSNKVTRLFNNQPFGGNENFRVISIVAVGQPIGEFYVPHFLGIDPQTGDVMQTDTSVYAGNPQPKYFGGWGNTFSWHGVDLHGFLEFSHGAKIFNLMRIFADDGGYHYDNKFTYALKRWQKPGDVTDEPRASYDGTSGGTDINDRFIEDGSYLRIQEITLAWHLPSSIATVGNLQNAQLFVTGYNLHTFTKYTGYDPDVNSNGGSSNIALGTDYYAYPRARTFQIGVRGTW